MFKYSPINTYSIRNLQRNQIYFNNPLNFNDPFDTFHPAEIKDLSDKKLIELYCRFKNSPFNEKALEKILNKEVSKDEFFKFCKLNVDFLVNPKDVTNENVTQTKKDFLENLESDLTESEEMFQANLDALIKVFKDRVQRTIKESIKVIRDEKFKKIGISCFSRNNKNLLMWSHYADSHRGFCLEFDSKHEPFSKAFSVIYQSDIPVLNTDLLFNEYENEEAIKKLLSFKSKNWSHEEELRIFYQESNKSYTYNAKLLKAIYFGLKTDESEIQVICSAVKLHNPDVKFFKMKRVENKFGLKPEEFTYQAPVEIRSTLLIMISLKFGEREFTIDELIVNTNGFIDKKNLQLYLDDLTLRKTLTKNGIKYKLSK